MPLIPFPNVPFYPGVPALVRGANVPVGIQVALAQLETLLVNAIQNGQQWGIFDSQGNELGLLASGGNSLYKSIITTITGNAAPVLSTNSFEFTKESKISDFPVEPNSFASYNKVILPSEPTVTLALQGSVNDRTTFLNLLTVACESTDLYNIVTPEVVYVNYSIERLNMTRRAERGATLIMVEVSLKQIRQVSAAYTTVQTPINQPQDPAATPQTNSGLVQPQPPSTSVLKSMWNAFPSLSGGK